MKPLIAALQSIYDALATGRIVDDEALAALTIWMEARGETHDGRTAVGEVIRNRMKAGKTVAEIVLAPYQFSCWNTKDENRIKALQLKRNHPQYRECLEAWLRSATSNLTLGATHYFNPTLANPSWKAVMTRTATIGHHDFYR